MYLLINTSHFPHLQFDDEKPIKKNIDLKSADVHSAGETSLIDLLRRLAGCAHLLCSPLRNPIWNTGSDGFSQFLARSTSGTAWIACIPSAPTGGFLKTCVSQPRSRDPMVLSTRPVRSRLAIPGWLHPFQLAASTRPLFHPYGISVSSPLGGGCWSDHYRRPRWNIQA